MARPHKESLRSLSDEEAQWLARLSQSRMAPASHLQRARLLLEVAAGKSYTQAARIVGRRCSDTVGHLVARFNQEGWPPYGCATVEDRPSQSARSSAPASSARRVERRRSSKTVRPHGRSRCCNTPCAGAA